MPYDLPIEHIIRPATLECPPHTPVREAARSMSEAMCSSILVVDNGEVTGIWTEKDALATDFSDRSSFDRPISGVMNSPVMTLHCKTSIGEAARYFKEKGVRHFLVLDDNGKHKGIITQSDVVRNPCIEIYIRLKIVKSLVKNKPLVIPANTRLSEAARIMRETQHEAAVVSFGEERGILTERNVVHAIGGGRANPAVAEIASKPLICVGGGSSLYSALNVFAEKGIRHLGVNDDDGKLLGIVAYSDIIASIEHDYVAELRQSLKDYEHKLHVADQHLFVAKKVFETAAEAITITDADSVIQSVNPAFTKITGFEAEEVIGKKTSVLKSGRHDPGFYKAMWDTLKTTGHWEGEIWDKRKNGEVYPKWLSIGSVRNPEGKITNYTATFSDVTDHKLAGEILRENGSRLNELFEHLSSGVAIYRASPDGQGFIVTAFNQAAERVDNIHREDVVGKNVVEVFPGVTEFGLLDVFRRVWQSGMAEHFPLSFYKGGRISGWRDNYVYKLSSGEIVAIYDDVTSEKQAEEALRVSEARLQATLDNSPYMIWQKDPDGRYIAFNQPFIKVAGGRQPQDVLGKTDLDLWPKELAEKYRADDIEVMSSRRQKVVEERAIKDGQVYWVETCKTPIVDKHGKLLGTTGFAQDITERRQYEEALKASEERWSFALEGGGDCVWDWNLQTGEVMLSKAGARMFGFAEDEIGNNIEEWRKRAHRDDMARIDEDLRAYLHGRAKNFVTEYRVRCKDGRWKWILSRGMLVSRTQEGKPLRMIGTHSDITGRREREEAMRLARTVFDSVDNAVVVTDRDNNIIEVNPAFTAITGYSALDVIGRNPRMFSSGMHPPAFYHEMWKALTTTGRWRGEMWNRRKNGEIYVESVSINLIRDEKNSLTHHVAVFSDITERQQYIEGLRKARQLAEEIAAAKSNFLANMSHEIRTPMNAIIGLSQLALNKQTTPEVRGYLEKILNSSDSLLDILNDILDFSKAEAGRMTIEHSNFDLDTVLENLDSLFAARAEDKYLDFSIEVSPDVPRGLVGDALRLQQVLSNLLGNAIKFTEHGKVTLRIGVKEIIRDLEITKIPFIENVGAASAAKPKDIAAEAAPTNGVSIFSKSLNEQATLLFRVEDTGIGIAQEDIAKLFQPFSQVDNSISRRFGGTGLGLSISHSLLRLMGSDIRVESAPGKGTTFSFELVLGIAPHAAHDKAARRKNQRKAGALSCELRDRGQPLAGARILVAEDDIINQQVVREFLELSGVTVALANNGKEVLELLDQGAFDAVLMDVHMPVMDGIEATRQIRAQARFARLPVIALTADIASEERESYLAGGMNDFVAKPIQPEELIAALVRWVKQDKVR